MLGQVAQLFDLELVALALVDVGEGGLAQFGSNAGRRVQDVLEPGGGTERTFAVKSGPVESVAGR